MVLSSCTSSTDALPPTPEVVGVSMGEYRYELRGKARSGRVVFQATNEGEIDHELTLISIPEDFALSIAEQVRGEVRQAFPTIAIIPPRAPGMGGEFAVDMTAGRYALVCFISDADGTSHAVKGMTAEFRIT